MCTYPAPAAPRPCSRRRFVSALLTFLLCWTVSASAFAQSDAERWQTQRYASEPADNPLKGLVPYAGAPNPDAFPHSMEFSYFPLSAVVKGEGVHDFGPLERFLEAVARRGHQAVFRFYLEYPDRQDAIPAYLLDGGLKTTQFERPSTPPRAPARVITPDYEDPALRAMLAQFIKALGERYDGDARIGFITAGLLGLWGEWHDSPRGELFASKAVQQEVMSAYAAAFAHTPVLLRYPAGASDPVYVDNAQTRFGYHDDSFAWGTLGAKSWFFMNRMRAAGPGALERWKTAPIGGEIRPEAWGKVFDAAPDNPNIEDFDRCVAETHASWLMDSGMFKTRNPEARRHRAIESVQRMGYAFHVSRVALTRHGDGLQVSVMLENRGVAPFYYDWKLSFALLDAKGQVRVVTNARQGLAGILPGEAATLATERFALRDVAPGRYRVLLAAPNPMPGGKPVRFANARQDEDLPGWLTLGEIDY